MKTLIVGSSRVLNLDSIHDAISQSNIDITELVMGSYFGTCPVISTYANVRNIPTKRFDKNIKDHKFDVIGRDIKMLIYSDVIMVLNDPDCKRTKHLETLANDIKKNVIKIDVPIVEELFKDRPFIYHDPAPFPKTDEAYIYVNMDEADPECESTADWSDEEYISDCDVFDDYFEDEDSDDSDNEE